MATKAAAIRRCHSHQEACQVRPIGVTARASPRRTRARVTAVSMRTPTRARCSAKSRRAANANSRLPAAPRPSTRPFWAVSSGGSARNPVSVTMAAATTATTAPSPPQINHRDRRRRGPTRSVKGTVAVAAISAETASPAGHDGLEPGRGSSDQHGGSGQRMQPERGGRHRERARQQEEPDILSLARRLPRRGGGDHPSQRGGAHDPEVHPLLLPEAVERRPHHQHAGHDERHEPDDPEREPASRRLHHRSSLPGGRAYLTCRRRWRPGRAACPRRSTASSRGAARRPARSGAPCRGPGAPCTAGGRSRSRPPTPGRRTRPGSR